MGESCERRRDRVESREGREGRGKSSEQKGESEIRAGQWAAVLAVGAEAVTDERVLDVAKMLCEIRKVMRYSVAHYYGCNILPDPVYHENTVKSGRHDIIVVKTQTRCRHTATHVIVGYKANEHARVLCRPYGHTAVAATCYEVLFGPTCKHRHW